MTRSHPPLLPNLCTVYLSLELLGDCEGLSSFSGFCHTFVPLLRLFSIWDVLLHSLLMSDFYLVFRSVPISPIFEIFGLSTNYYYGIIAISEELTRLSMVLNWWAVLFVFPVTTQMPCLEETFRKWRKKWIHPRDQDKAWGQQELSSYLSLLPFKWMKSFQRES